MSQTVYVAGVGMIPFTKPGASEAYYQMGAKAAAAALDDAGVGYDKIDQAYAGFIYADSCAGQRAVYEVGMTGIPVFNVNNNCATGSTALYLARQAIESGTAECVLVVGFDQMVPGALAAQYSDRPSVFDRFNAVIDAKLGASDVPGALRIFGSAGLAHMERFGTRLETFAKIRAKASRHAANNPLAVFRNVVSPEDVMASPMLWPGVMTRLMACPPTCGAAAAVICSDAFARRHGLRRDVRLAAQAMTTDRPTAFDGTDMREVAGFSMSRDAAHKVYELAGVGPEDIDVVELHDCFAHNELLTYEALGLCPEGGAEKFIEDGDNTYGGKVVTNPSGGLLSKGHPLGATGLAQCYELVSQLRGNAADRQVADARLALQHNIGIGGACVVTLYERT